MVQGVSSNSTVQHHCPRKSHGGFVTSKEGQGRRWCLTHQMRCPKHRKIFLFGETCGTCARTKAAAERNALAEERETREAKRSAEKTAKEEKAHKMKEDKKLLGHLTREKRRREREENEKAEEEKKMEMMKKEREAAEKEAMSNKKGLDKARLAADAEETVAVLTKDITNMVVHPRRKGPDSEDSGPVDHGS